MRTTITISDELLADAKRLAADRQSSLSVVISEALRQVIKENRAPATRAKFTIPTYGGDSMAQAITPADIAELIAEEDIQSYR